MGIFSKKVRVYKTKIFAKWSTKEKISDSELRGAVDEITRGLVDADLGGNIYKKRLATLGMGKRAGARTILAYQLNSQAFFVFGFKKAAKDNITREELKQFKLLARQLLSYDHRQIKKALKLGDLKEI